MGGDNVSSRMKLSDVGKNVGVGTKVDGIELITAKNPVAICRWLCLRCEKAKECDEGLAWRMVIERAANGVDVWGLNCEARNVRVINGIARKIMDSAKRTGQ